MVAFSVKTPRPIEAIANAQNVPVLSSSVIYKLMDAVTERVAALLPPIVETRVSGEATVIQLFDIQLRGKRTTQFGGCRVASGVVEVDETPHTTMIPRLGIDRTHKDFDKCVGEWVWVLSILTTTCRLPLGTRTHHRVLMFPFADDVTSVKNPLELLHVLCDAVLGLSALPTLVSR